MRSTTVDPVEGTVRVDGGCIWADVDHATVAFGMATPSGFLASTGVGGLTLGGGIGYLARRYGLTVDNLLSADVVLADGSLVIADESHHSDLFWALRGGGGNFGVVTSFTFRCNPIGEGGVVVGGPVLYDIGDTARCCAGTASCCRACPRSSAAGSACSRSRRHRRSPRSCGDARPAASSGATPAPHDRADELLAPVREFGSPLLVGIAPMPFTALQSAFDALYPAGLQWYWRADFFDEITDEAIDVHRRFGDLLPTGHSTMHLYPIDGAASRVDEDGTPFAYRNGGWAGVIVGVDPDPANAELIASWTRDYWDACTRTPPAAPT